MRLTRLKVWTAFTSRSSLSTILLVVGDGHLVQLRLWLKIAHTKIDATMLKAVTQDRNQTILRDGIFKCLIKLPNRVDRTHPLKAFPCHGLGTFYEIGQSDDVQKHIWAKYYENFGNNRLFDERHISQMHGEISVLLLLHHQPWGFLRNQKCIYWIFQRWENAHKMDICHLQLRFAYLGFP